MLVRLVTAIGIVMPILAARVIRGEGMPWAVVFIVAAIGFGTGRIVEGLVARGRTRRAQRAGWAIMIAGSALAAVYALAGSFDALGAKVGEWTAHDAGPPPPATPWEHHAGKWLRVSVGANGVCALRRADSAVVCWGNPARGWPEKQTTVTDLGAAINEVVVTDRIVCARSSSDGAVRCGTVAGEKRQAMDSTRSFSPLAAGAGHACAIGADDSVQCWRDEEPYAPARVAGISGSVTALSASGIEACAIVESDALCWTLGSSEARPMNGVPKSVSDVVAGPHGGCVSARGRLVCWGSGPPANGPAAEMPGMSDVRSFALGADHLCAVQGNRLRCAGRNDHGQLARHDLADAGFNVVSGTELHEVRQVAIGGYASCAIDDDGEGELVCWGKR